MKLDKLKIKQLVDEDFVNYKKPSMFIGFPTCSFKCDKESRQQVCQNSALADAPIIEMEYEDILKRYLNNPITEAIVIGGLEPFDTFNQLEKLVWFFRDHTDDDIVIYSGYNPEEIKSYVDALTPLKNIIIKYGRFKPDQPHHYDKVLGIELASDNQYAERYE